MADSDALIVGAGIVGLATAIAAHRRGQRVTIVDRHHTPVGASIRNFGMIWPIGQPKGPLFDLAMRSRAIWLELAEQAGFFCEQSGSMHLARREDELRVLEEFVATEGDQRRAQLLSPEDVRTQTPGVNPDGLLGGMYSPLELNVESRTAIRKIWDWIADQPRIELISGFDAARVAPNRVESSDGRVLEGGHVYLTAGSDGVTHYPDCFPSDAFTPCKLQMMRTIPQPGGWTMGTHVAGGWTLRHYGAFADCPSLPQLKERISREQPEFDTHGIHIMLSQHSAGDLVIGDSHVYGDAITPFDDERVDRLILEHAKQLVDAPSWMIDKRWHGIYLKRTDGRSLLVEHPEAGVTMINAMGGAGMTLSFGVADLVIRDPDTAIANFGSRITQSV
ncbi:MAG: TIGR03364 family FAD-dependent oxidoreductase [Phycisphaerales bacterium]